MIQFLIDRFVLFIIFIFRIIIALVAVVAYLILIIRTELLLDSKYIVDGEFVLAPLTAMQQKLEERLGGCGHFRTIVIDNTHRLAAQSYRLCDGCFILALDSHHLN